MDGLVWIRGRLSPPSEAVLPVLDRAVLYGDAVFETLRAYGGKAFACRAHLERLAASAAAIGLGLTWGLEELDDVVRRTLQGARLTGAQTGSDAGAAGPRG
jgi:branched-subunit amino acid aminotransferase/4-amino-4-deoxychorismate lyase